MGVSFDVFSSTTIGVINVIISCANLALQLVEGSVGRSASLVAANGSKLVKVDLEGNLV